MSKYIIIVSTLALIIIITLWLYVLKNNSGHTGFNLNWLYLFFIPLTLFGIIKIKNNKLAITSIFLGILGIGSLAYLDKTNTLLQYNIWVERGMPNKNEN